MFIDPTLISWLLIGAASFAAFMIGRNTADTKELVIEETILYLIHNNFVRARKVDGEWDIIPLDEEN